MINFIVPAIIFGTKVVVKHTVTEAITEGVSQAEYEVDKKTTKTLVSTVLNIVINIFLLIISVYIAPLFLDKNAVIYLVSSIYLGSILYGIYSLAHNAPSIYKYIFIYGFNLKDYVEDEIYVAAKSEASLKIKSMFFIKRGINSLFGESASSIAGSIASLATRIVMRKIITIAVTISIITFLYVVIFRLMVAPILIENSTNFTLLQAALYPVTSSIDYFFKTHITEWLL